MREIINQKLHKISEIWEHYIWEYKFCNSKIRFSPDVRSNYFGDILSYFSDTLNIVYNYRATEVLSENIGQSISFLQAIYIQQDLIEELLYIFKCGINKGDLKKDDSYSINRDLRNELVGHPIRKDEFQGTRQLLSSTIFSNSTNASQISYLRYHRNSGYQFELITHRKDDILKRHNDFLSFYLDIILNKLKKILILFKKKIKEIEGALEHASFEGVIKITCDSYEYIFKTDYLYNPDILLQVNKMRNLNQRYSTAIEIFRGELNRFLLEHKEDIENLLTDNDGNSTESSTGENIMPEIEFIDDDNNINVPKAPVSYSYELGHLSNKDDIIMFTFFSSVLKERCKGNEVVLAEIQNMEVNLDNDLEYYCSLHLISKILNTV